LTSPDETTLAQINQEVEEMTSVFPLYQPTRRPSGVRRTA
jgi:hypothetical protein